MSWNSFARKIVTVVVAVAVLTGTSATAAAATASPAASQDDDGLLSDDDGDDGGLLTNTTDSLTDTVDSTTGGATEPVTDPVDSTLSTTTDTVESTAGEPVDQVVDSVGTGDVTSPTNADDVVGVTDDVTETVSDGSLPADSVPADSVPTDSVPADSLPLRSLPVESLPVGSLPVGSLPVGTLPTDSVPTDSVPADSLPVGSEQLPTSLDSLENQEYSTDDLPVEESAVLEPVDETLPTGDEAPVQPEDSPYGSQGTGLNDACSLPVNQEDLPLEAVPKPDELPVRPSVPGVPVDLLTPQNVAGIALAVPPRPCSVYDPHDPSFDPTNPPTDPAASYENEILVANSDVVHWVGESDGRLQRDGFSHDAIWGIRATHEEAGAAERFTIHDGSGTPYLGLNSSFDANRTARTGTGSAGVWVFGKNVGGKVACDATKAGNVSLDEPAKGCDYSIDGLITPPMGPGELIDTVQNPPEDPPVSEDLPPVGSLPGNAAEIIHL